MKMRIVICDDDRFFCNETKNYCLSYLKDKGLNCEILEFSSGEEVLAYEGTIDLLLLDIQMKEIDGITVKNKLRELKKDTKIIFLTSHREMMQDAFGGQVYSFLCKPIKKEPFYKAMDLVMKELNEDFVVDLICYDKKHYITGKDILYLKAEDKYTRVITNKKEFLDGRNMKEWEKLLEGYHFYRSHKSYIINLAHVNNYRDVIIMDNGHKVNVSRRNLKDFRDLYSNYMRGQVR